MAWQIESKNGIHLPQIGWHLDASRPVPRSVVTHAHSDHVARHKEMILTPATARLVRARLPGRRTEHVLSFGHTEQLTEDCTVTLHPAGHILGSALCLLNHTEHGTLLYTGDFKLRPGRAAEVCATPRADTVIMETTFGLPRYAFPPADEIRAAIVAFCRESLTTGRTPVLFAYSLGKTQELLATLAGADLPVMLHGESFRLTRIHEQLGLTFPAYREFDAREVAGHVVICPQPFGRDAFLQKIPGARTALISGWAMDRDARFRGQCDAAFPLSDHADFPDLLRFVELTQAKRVFTVHGFAREFAATLRARGIEAWALGRTNQMEFSLPSTAT